MRKRDERPTQEVLEAALSSPQPTAAEPAQPSEPMGTLKFLGRVVAEVIEKLPHNT
jgi:hypothetical protein